MKDESQLFAACPSLFSRKKAGKAADDDLHCGLLVGYVIARVYEGGGRGSGAEWLVLFHI